MFILIQDMVLLHFFMKIFYLFSPIIDPSFDFYPQKFPDFSSL